MCMFCGEEPCTFDRPAAPEKRRAAPNNSPAPTRLSMPPPPGQRTPTIPPVPTKPPTPTIAHSPTTDPVPTNVKRLDTSRLFDSYPDAEQRAIEALEKHFKLERLPDANTDADTGR